MSKLTITLCFTAVLVVYSVQGADSERKKGFEKMKKGENFTMKCNTMDKQTDTLNIYSRLPSKHVVLAYDIQTNVYTFGPEYSKRLTISGTAQKLTVTIRDMQPNDSGLYIGQYTKFNISKGVEEGEEGCSSLLFVYDVDKTVPTEKSTSNTSHAMSEPLVLVFALIACTIFLVCFLMIWMCVPKIKAKCVKQHAETSREYSPVYEDMHRVQNK
ncbi:hypothetical protein Q7C36_017189 [Tachysurus vachellii]|uniref:Immunoglobulin V-set domain-containing protein n=1 Tax=Tachysurus vachellii TaxID=175792 RepID=A0AA88M4Q9_TACVA|nr:hypothetical protein Q7C36_017189 [Tachysurus vachellii]